MLFHGCRIKALRFIQRDRVSLKCSSLCQQHSQRGLTTSSPVVVYILRKADWIMLTRPTMDIVYDKAGAFH